MFNTGICVLPHLKVSARLFIFCTTYHLREWVVQCKMTQSLSLLSHIPDTVRDQGSKEYTESLQCLLEMLVYVLK